MVFVWRTFLQKDRRRNGAVEGPELELAPEPEEEVEGGLPRRNGAEHWTARKEGEESRRCWERLSVGGPRLAAEVALELQLELELELGSDDDSLIDESGDPL